MNHDIVRKLRLGKGIVDADVRDAADMLEFLLDRIDNRGFGMTQEQLCTGSGGKDECSRCRLERSRRWNVGILMTMNHDIVRKLRLGKGIVDADVRDAADMLEFLLDRVDNRGSGLTQEQWVREAMAMTNARDVVWRDLDAGTWGY